MATAASSSYPIVKCALCGNAYDPATAHFGVWRAVSMRVCGSCGDELYAVLLERRDRHEPHAAARMIIGVLFSLYGIWLLFTRMA